MSEERTCPLWYETKINKRPPCGAKIVRREPVESPKRYLTDILGPKEWEGGRIKLEEMIPYYIYQCEKGHLIYRPEWWADVPTVPQGTIKDKFGLINPPTKWPEKWDKE